MISIQRFFNPNDSGEITNPIFSYANFQTIFNIHCWGFGKITYLWDWSWEKNLSIIFTKIHRGNHPIFCQIRQDTKNLIDNNWVIVSIQRFFNLNESGGTRNPIFSPANFQTIFNIYCWGFGKVRLDLTEAQRKIYL